jgi:carbohydrate-selective porin OprB
VADRMGKIRLLAYNTLSQAPSYEEGIQAIAQKNNFLLDVIQGNDEHNIYGGRKFGVGINIEQEISKHIGMFGRLGWNDGKYVSWAFTEVDKTANLGFSFKELFRNRPNDVVGFATSVNGISKEHQEFLKAGGYGFIIGDGNLNYDLEHIIETYYSTKLNKFLWLSFDYQFVINPGYNKDRGPVHVFGLRGHVEF